MHRTEADNNIEVLGLKLYADGPPGTTLTADDRNTIQEELAYLIEQNGLTLKTAATETDQQIYEAVAAQVAAGPNSKLIDFGSNNLIIDVQSNTTCDADVNELSLLNNSLTPAFISDLSTTFNITTDRMAGTSEKASHWYQLWFSVTESDGAVTRMMVPDLVSTADSNVITKLVDSGATFVTDLVQVGDIVYNLTDLTQGIVVTVENETTILLNADIFPDGNENYKIRMLSPIGLGAYKARIGAAYNNSGSNLDNSTYTQIQEEKSYSVAAGNFTITAANWTTGSSLITVRQINDWTGAGIWKNNFNFSGTFGSAGAVNAKQFTVTGIVNKNSGFDQAISVTDRSTNARNAGEFVTGFALPNAGTYDIFCASAIDFGSGVAKWAISGDVEQEKKPTFHS